MIYLDNGATSWPKPEKVYTAVEDCLRHHGGNPGRSGHTMSLDAARVIFNARETLAKLLNIENSSRIVFTKNATEAINIALKGILNPGDHLITSAFEHNCVYKTSAYLESIGVEVTRLKGDPFGYIDSTQLAPHIKENTKMVCLPHASNVIGTINPINEIGSFLKNQNILFMIDAAQTAGAMPLDIKTLDIDIVAGTGHKSLLGPPGSGFLYLKESIEPRPLIHGGTGIKFDPETPDRLETGTMNAPALMGLQRGIEYIMERGVENIRADEVSLIEMLLSGLQKINGVKILGSLKAQERASLVCFNIDGYTSTDLCIKLDEGYKIMTRPGDHCSPQTHMLLNTYPEGALRVAPGCFTKEEHIETLIKALKEITL